MYTQFVGLKKEAITLLHSYANISVNATVIGEETYNLGVWKNKATEEILEEVLQFVSENGKIYTCFKDSNNVSLFEWSVTSDIACDFNYELGFCQP